MKRLFLSLTGLLMLGYAQNFALAAAPATSAPEDTIIITMPDKSKMVIYVKDKKDLKNFNSFNVDSLIASLSAYMNTGAQPGTDTTITVPNAGKDGGGQVKVTVAGATRAEAAQIKAMASLRRQVELLDNSIATLDKQRNNKALSATERESLNSSMKELMAEKESLNKELRSLQSELRANRGATVSVTVGDGNNKVTAGNGTVAVGDTAQKKFKPWYNEFGIDLGFNAFTKNERYQNPATGEIVNYDLRPFGSRYVSLNWITGSVIGGKGSPFRIQSGVEFNFNNLMWDNNVRIESVDGKPVFFKEEGLSLEKSKLALTYVTVPLMTGVQFKNTKGKDTFRFMAGGYAGYRIGTHSKIKYTNEEGDSKKDKDKGSFGLEDYQYGVSAQIGYRNFVLFSKYNLSEVFKNERGPQAQLISFGITL